MPQPLKYISKFFFLRWVRNPGWCRMKLAHKCATHTCGGGVIHPELKQDDLASWISFSVFIFFSFTERFHEAIGTDSILICLNFGKNIYKKRFETSRTTQWSQIYILLYRCHAALQSEKIQLPLLTAESLFVFWKMSTKVMAVCIFPPYFPDFWNTAILCISSGLKNAICLLKEDAKK